MIEVQGAQATLLMEAGRLGEFGIEPMQYCGVDIADATFTATHVTTPTTYRYLGEFANTPTGFRKLLRLLPAVSDCQIILEATGVYADRFCHYFFKHGYALCVEPPLKVKRAFYERAKTDPIDSRLLGEYGYRFPDRLHPWQPKSVIIEQLQVLCTVNEQFTHTRTALKNAKKALTKKQRDMAVPMRLQETLIYNLRQSHKTIEQEITRVMKRDPDIYRHFTNLQTIPGVGIWLSTYFLILTEGGTQHTNGKELASYLGICPFRQESGKTKKRPKKDKAGPGYIASLFFLGSMTCSKNNPHMHAYYQRLLQQGKDKPLALNNLANKLLHLMCAIVTSGDTYHATYHSIPSTF